MAVINHPVCAARNLLADTVIHEMRREFTGRARAIAKAPDNSPGIPLVVDLHDADICRRVELHIPHKPAAARGDEILPGKIVRLDAHVHPRAGRLIEERARRVHILLLHAVGQVAAVSLMPSLLPSVGAQTDKSFHCRYLFYSSDRHCIPPADHFRLPRQNLTSYAASITAPACKTPE